MLIGAVVLVGGGYASAKLAVSYVWGSRTCDRVAFLGQSRPEAFATLSVVSGLPDIFHSEIGTPECCAHIAHAGGASGDMPYTNSPEALNENYEQGVRVFELDFVEVENGEIVIAHDFDDLDAVPDSEAAFLATTPWHKRSRMSFAGLIEWMKDRPDARIVTDTKFAGGPKRIIEAFSAHFSPDELSDRLIVQLYSLDEFTDPDLRGGDIPVILTLYRMLDEPYGEVIEALEANPPVALTMGAGPAPKLLQWTRWYLPDLPVYIHGRPDQINDTRFQICLEGLGASGFYLD